MTASPDIDAFLAQQQQQDLLRLITCGSVDDGKSTLLGRLLWESQQLFDDQILALQADSKKYGTQGQSMDFALLVDGLSAEREQGITIDVAYRFFSSELRKFIVADTPGHEQYTRNMITGASTADLAVLLVDARTGLLTQTRRHAYLVSLMGIRHVVLAVNKMDLVNFSAQHCLDIQTAFHTFAAPLGFVDITTIPLSARDGDNITQHSLRTPWYTGPTLMGHLQSVSIRPKGSQRMAFPVQWVNRPHADFRGFSGTLAQGQLRVGEDIVVTASGQKARVSDIVTFDGPLTIANAGQAVTVCLDREIDVSRGDILTHSQTPLPVSDQFEATLIWLHTDESVCGRSYELKLATQWANASLTHIQHRIDIHTGDQEACNQLGLNDIAVCHIATTRPIAYEPFADSHALGSFILVDRFSHATVAAGLIRRSLSRSQNVYRQALSITRKDREKFNAHRGMVVWFTGLSGSGKSTLANALEVQLHQQGYRTYLLDGDNIRQGLNKDLGFSEADRVENIRRIAEVAQLMCDAGLIVLTAFISPFRQDRAMARERIGSEHFIEVHVNTPLPVCEQRDVKGLYQKARSGLLPNMTGISSPYEAPEAPDYVAQAGTQSVQTIVADLMKLISAEGVNL